MKFTEIFYTFTDVMGIFLNKIVWAFWFIISSIFLITGGKDKMMSCLLILMGIDYASGVIKAYIIEKMNSKQGFKGILKKILTIMIVVLAYQIDMLLEEKIPIRLLTIGVFISNEGLSILENAATCGIPIPEKLKNVLEQYKAGKNVGGK